MSLDPRVTVAGLIVGFIVGMTGMGGGALMTPILVILFRVPPLAAVSSDLVASMIMKPIGGAVHWRRGTVLIELVGLLALGSVPAAFAGVLIIRLLGHGPQLQQRLTVTLGIAIVLAAISIVLKEYLRSRQPEAQQPLRVKRLRTILIGSAGGVMVGMTSVGSGSLIIAGLMLLYPALKSSELVGTDLVQAIPLVASAAIAHMLFGDFRLPLTASILLGSIPGVYLGAKVSSVSPGWFVKPALIVVLVASGVKLMNISTSELGLMLLSAALLAAGSAAVLARRVRPQPRLAALPIVERDAGALWR